MGHMTLVQGDLTKMEVDAIVNAANNSLLGGGGVDGAIHRAGGPAILAECREIRARQGGCPTGEAVVTTAGNMPSRFVIHTVGPVWSGHDKEAKDDLLRNCYKNSLKHAAKINLETIAFPNISTGIYHFPKERAADIAIQAVKEMLEEYKVIKEVIFVCFDNENYDLYQEKLANLSKEV